MRFRIEYKESLGQWHHASMSGNREPNTNGWVTILDDVSTKDAWLFESLVEFATGRIKGQWTTDELLEFAKRFPTFKAEKERLSL